MDKPELELDDELDEELLELELDDAPGSCLPPHAERRAILTRAVYFKQLFHRLLKEILMYVP